MIPVKKTGVKLHIGVDIAGLPHALLITPADVTDRDGAIEMMNYYYDVTDHLDVVLKVLADGGYRGDNFAQAVASLGWAEVEVVKRNEQHKFSVIPQRWVVERSFGWLDKCRRLWKNCERKLENTIQMVVVAFVRLLLKRRC